MITEDAIPGRTICCSERRSATGSQLACTLPIHRVLECLVVIIALAIAQPAAADEATCGTLRNTYGPFDYRTASARQIQLVEDYHFTPSVEELKHGKSGLAIGADLDYTLRAIPNHHRALVAMMELGFKVKKDPPPGAQWRVACYFDRAIRFSPDDGAVHTIFGIYMFRRGKISDATAQFEMAEKLGDNSGNMHYNAGLAYFELGDYDKAVVHAKKAAEAGFSLPGLRDKLQKIGKWPAD
jgi:tetratricopeptide (TPR) repeat protein